MCIRDSGTSSQGIFGTGVSVALDPRSIGTQIDDNIMQKNLSSRLLLKDKKYVLYKAGHWPLPRNQMITETLTWLDKYEAE